MSIWRMEPTVEQVNAMCAKTMVEYLGIEFVEIGDDWVRASMPVDGRTRQPAGLLHGGASVTLAESLGSVAAHLCIDPQQQSCVGLEINANHLRAVRSGKVLGIARPRHVGRATQVWEMEITNEEGRLVCVSRLTLAVVDRGPTDVDRRPTE